MANVRGLRARTGEMDSNGRTTVKNADYLQTELTSLSRNIDSLMGIWRGGSANQFKQSYDQQARNFTEFQLLLNDLGESISAAAGILNAAEENNASKGAHLFNL